MKKSLLFFAFFFLCAVFGFAQNLDGRVRDAVNGLASRLTLPLEVKIGTVTPKGSGTPNAFSRYLGTKINQYAVNNSRFAVTARSRGPSTRSGGAQQGTISGSFTQKDGMVEVTLELISDGKVTLYSQSFTVSTAELQDLGIELEPENQEEVEEREKIFAELNIPDESPEVPAAQTAPSFTIHAWTDSETNTYYASDRLQLTVESGRDCYFKVYHIDVNNVGRLIYPNQWDRDNRLRANTPRSLFESQSFILYEPYGAESILIKASTEQFSGLEAEFSKEWKVSLDSVRSAAGTRGGGFSGGTNPLAPETSVSLSYTILKPDEEYAYKTPNDLPGAVETMRNEALRQEGTFQVTSIGSGFFMMNNVRGSYYLKEGAPDTLYVTIYYDGRYTERRYTPPVTRGAGFNFSFEKPRNLSQAVQAVRSGIESKGGTFTGNEQQGSFRAGGISGAYNITDRVMISITEKPFIIPNSMIEKEVKGYFNGR